jgi:phosphoglycerol transferase MdoB-like AlkP superfamily enzyme
MPTVRRLRFLALYFLFWIGCFEGGRVLFLLYQWRNTVQLDARLIAGIFVHGLRMDVSLVCAIMLIPLCVVARAGFIPERMTRRMIAGYTVSILAIWALATIADLEIFSVWGYRLDASPLYYLSSSREVVAATAGSPIVLLTVLLLLALGLGSIVFSRALLPRLDHTPSGQLQSILLVAMVMPALTVGTRGGFDWHVPITEGSVYFSRDNFANQAAINPVWNFFASAIGGSGDGAMEPFAELRVAQTITDSLLAQRSPSVADRAPQLLKSRPNKIVIVFWESFTAKIAEPLGGLSDVTPAFTRLSHEGILFDNFYAAGQRTTNGLVAALAGFPSHPRRNPLRSQELDAGLPRLSVAMANNGYHTGFYYGARLSFDSRNRFLLHGHYDDIIEKRDFVNPKWTSVWGVHDPIVLDTLFNALNNATQPMFAVALTISSHEPWDVPGEPQTIRGDEKKFLYSQRYTDRAVSQFIERCKLMPWWDSTLVIILADHGSRLPGIGSRLASAPENFRIPMLWLGGAINQHDRVVHKIGSQADLSETLLAEIGIAHANFRWSKDFLAPESPEFAFYAFRDGFGYVDRRGTLVFDNVAKSVIMRSGHPSMSELNAGRAFQQVVAQAYHDLGDPRGH